MPAANTGDAHVDSIVWGDSYWMNGPISYYFADDYAMWTNYEKAAYKNALDAWASVANVTFVEVNNEAAANLVAHVMTNEQMKEVAEDPSLIYGMHEVPQGPDYAGVSHGYFNNQTYNFPTESGVDQTEYAQIPAQLGNVGPSSVGHIQYALEPGQFGFTTMLHELGHALGLAHPHDTSDGNSTLMPGVADGASGDLGTHELNQSPFSVMSYNSGWNMQNPWEHGVNDRGYNWGPGAFDVAAIQFHYGANTNYKGGANVYRLTDNMGWGAIWDTGGKDKIVYDGSEDVVIQLRSATLDGGPNAGGFMSHVTGGGNFGGYTIAGDFTDALADEGSETGVIIEHAIGGHGDDKLVGNGVNNLLRGRGGDDMILGGGGNDKGVGGKGDDRLVGHGGNDRLLGDNGHDVLIGGNGADRLLGGNGDDALRGNVGNDIMNGGKGDDVLHGGGGSDRFQFKDGYGDDTVLDFNVLQDMLRIDDALWAGMAGIVTGQDVVDAFASVTVSGDVVFDFGDDTLTLADLGSLAGVAATIVIV